MNNDREMPLLGLGVYKLPDDVQAEAAVTSAISAGFRMIDTASVYKNEESVGRAIAKCGVPRKTVSFKIIPPCMFCFPCFCYYSTKI